MDTDARTSQSEAARTFVQAQAKLRGWQPILQSIAEAGENAFTFERVHIGCGFSFDTAKESKVELIKRDRLAASDSPETREEILTVVCSSPLSTSGGAGVSSLDENTIAFVASTKTATGSQPAVANISRFGFTDRSTYRLLPLVLINTRVWEPNETFSLHGSAGVAVNLNTGAVGTDVDYVFGPSVAFRRSLFMTVGWHFGRVANLAGGFKEGEEVPTLLSAPPVEKARATGAIFAMTFRLR